jgi:predicted transposase YdaD
MRKGLEQGRVEGRIEGRVEGSLQIVLRLLAHRLGAVPPAMGARIHALSAGQLQELAEALLDFTEPADLERWLTR